MANSDAAALAAVKARTWFYQFELPDGTLTRTDIPAHVIPIHGSRREKLRRIIKDKVPGAANLTALDFASHEGYYAAELSKHFKSVRGLELRPESLAASQLMMRALGVSNTEFKRADLQTMTGLEDPGADFVLVYGLLYHLEDPIHTIRLASKLARKHILIETQVFPYDVSGKIEDGNFHNQRDVQGVFSLSVDYAANREGGSTDLALVPSLNALMFLLRTFGFAQVMVVPPDPGDYEQFSRGARVIVYGAKP